MASDRPARLQIHQHLGFQHRFRIFRRFGMAALVLLLLAAASGLLGSGPLATTGTSAGPVTIDYPRFLHRGFPTLFELRVEEGGGPVEVALDGALVDHFDLDRVTPKPVEAARGDGRLLLQFAAGTTAIRLELTPRRMGPLEGGLGAGADSARLRMFVYP